ncbi:MAG: hypothetical protein AAGA54_20430 [Myxococcota bacterium]
MTDDLDRNDLDAWTVEPLPDDFDARVLAAWDEAQPSVERRPSRVGWTLALLLAAAAALAVVLRPRDERDAEAIAMRASASAQVTFAPGSDRAVQRTGTVTYVVPKGTPFVVQTPAAEVLVEGTEFTVEMLTMNDERRRTYLGAGALALGGAAVAVYVTTGDALVRNDHGGARVGPTQTAVASEHVAPRNEPAPIVAKAPRPRAPTKLTAAQRRDVQRRLADALAERRTAPPKTPDEGAAEEAIAGDLGVLQKEYIREVVAEDLVPLASECYESVLANAPDLGGRVVMRFSIVGDESVGGLVEEVAFEDPNAPQDPEAERAVPSFPLAEHPEFEECMRESTASMLFEPPQGGGRVTVTYPIVFANEAESDAASAE